MKNFKIYIVLSLFFAISATAQEIADHTAGLRLGDSDAFGAEISYQHALGRTNRLEVNLGWRDHRAYNAIKFTGTYQFIYTIDGNFNWYYGFGGGIGNASFEPTIDNLGAAVEPDGGVFIFAAGTIGVEYNFPDLPLLLSLDIRPEFGLLGYNNFKDNFDFDIALGVRYQF